MRFDILSVSALFVALATAGSNPIMGRTLKDATCSNTLASKPLPANDCITVPNDGAVLLSKDSRCYAFKDSKCGGHAKKVESPIGCHSVKSWGSPVAVRCVRVIHHGPKTKPKPKPQPEPEPEPAPETPEPKPQPAQPKKPKSPWNSGNSFDEELADEADEN